MNPDKNIGGWYFGWNIVAVATVMSLMTVGMRMGVGPFFLPIARDLEFSRSLLAGIVAIGMLFYGIGMPLAGHFAGTRGTRFVLLLGATMVVTSIVWATLARGPVSFLLSFGVLLSLGLSFTSSVALTPVICRWFKRQRGMALFFMSTGSMAGIAILTPVFSYAIVAVGWRNTMLGFAALFALVTVPAALWVIRDDAPANADLPPGAPGWPDGLLTEAGGLSWRDAVCTMPFWKVALGLFTCGYSMNLLGTHGVPMLMDHGFDPMTSSLGIGTIGLVAIFSTVALGRLSDAVPRKNILAAIYLIRGLSFFGLLMVATPWQLYMTSAIGGLVWAGSVALSSAILADVYGTRIVGILYGLTFLVHQVGAMVSTWLGGWAYETYGTHWIAFGSAGVLLLAAAVLSLRLPAMEGYAMIEPSRRMYIGHSGTK